MKNSIICILILFNLNAVIAQDTITISFNSQEIAKYGGEWNLYDASSNSYYKLNSEVISIKYEQNATGRQISSFGQYHQTPNDPQFSNQWYAAVTDLTDAWDLEDGSNSEVIVAVIDGGFNWDNEDIGYGNDSYQNVFK